MISRILPDIRYSARSFSRTPGLSLALLLTIALGVGSNAAVNGFVQGLTKSNSPLAGMDRVISIFGRDARGEASPATLSEYKTLKAQTDLFEWIGAAQVTRADQKTIAAVTPELAGTPHPEGLYVGQPIDVWEPLKDLTQTETRNVWIIARLRPGAPPPKGDFHIQPYTGMTPQTAAGYGRAALILWIAAGAVFFIATANAASFLLGRATSRSHETSLRIALGATQRQLARQLLSDSVLLGMTGGVLGILIALWTSQIIPSFLFAEDAERLVFAPSFSTVAAASAICIAITIACGLLPLIAIPQARPVAVLRRESTGPSPLIRRVRTGIMIVQLACCCALTTSTAFLVAGLRSATRTSAGRVLGNPILATVQTNPDVGLPYFERIERVAREMPAVRETAWVAVPPGSQPTWMSFRIEPRQLTRREVTLQTFAFSPPMAETFRLPALAGRMFGAIDRGCRAAIVNEAAAAVLYGDETPGRTLQDSAGQPVVVVGVVGQRAGPRPPSIYYYEDQGGGQTLRFSAPVPSKLQRAELAANVVSPNYFETIVAGKFTGDACRTAIVNQEAADLYFGGDPIGAAVIENNGRRTEVVGVVRQTPIGAFQRREEPGIYFPMTQDWRRRMTIVLQTEDAELVNEVERRFKAVDGAGPDSMIVKTLETHLNETSLAPLRIVTVIATASTAIALLLGLVGLFGMLSDAARQRSRDLTIRIALGASRRHVIGHILKDGGKLAAAGTLAGLLGSLLLARHLSPITPANYSPALWVFLAGPAVLTVAVLIASILPARQAAMADPLTLLRDNT